MIAVSFHNYNQRDKDLYRVEEVRQACTNHYKFSALMSFADCIHE